MAMFPNASRGYMPFVHGKSGNTNTTVPVKNKRSKLHVNGGKLYRSENNRKQVTQSLSNSQKMYQITLKDKKGVTYKCIVKTDGGTKSLPELCEKKLNVVTHRSLPDISTLSSPEKQRHILSEKLDALNSVSKSEENFSTSLDLRNCGKKEGIFSAFMRFIKEKTGKNEKDNASKNTVVTSKVVSNKHHKSHGKSKRKSRDLSQRKRQRTVSAMSNLDPIQESPNEQEYELDDDDNESYTHFSSGCPSDCDSVDSQISCNIEQVEEQS